VSVTAAHGSPLSDTRYVPREVMVDLKGSSFEDKNDFLLNYVGRELVAAP